MQEIIKKLGLGSMHCNIGMLMNAVITEGNHSDDQLKTMDYLYPRLSEATGGLEIPLFSEFLQKFTADQKMVPVNVLDEDESAEPEELDEHGYADLTDIMLFCETLYLIAVSSHFFSQYRQFQQQMEISAQQYMEACAFNSMKAILKGSQVTDFRFSERRYAGELCGTPMNSALRPIMEALMFLGENHVSSTAYELGGLDSLMALNRFRNDLLENLLCLNEQYASGYRAFSY